MPIAIVAVTLPRLSDGLHSGEINIALERRASSLNDGVGIGQVSAFNLQILRVEAADLDLIIFCPRQYVQIRSGQEHYLNQL